MPRQQSDESPPPRSVSVNGHHEKLSVLSEQERLEWVVLGKVTTRTYGLVLDSLLREIVPLESEISYWRDVLGSYRYTSLYSVQTSPSRLWGWSRNVWSEVSSQETGFNDSWRHFYQRVRLTLHHKSLHDIRSSISMPMTTLRRDLQKKQERLERLKRQYAGSIGFLLSQGTEIARNQRSDISTLSDGFIETRSRVSRYLAVMDAAISVANATSESEQPDLAAFDISQTTGNVKTPKIFEELQSILQHRLPDQSARIDTFKKRNGRPSALTRYWIPAIALLLSSSTILRILLNRKTTIRTWLNDSINTCVDFYHNWVLNPARKLVGTIRHDADSEVSIMSKRSLEGDRESLERMVVDFATQHPEGAQLSAEDIAAVQAKVREGDLTPVLKVYERDMQSPLWRSVRGTLIRALLIQIQKTKVDVEVAMGGIDALLKSQELVFGFLSVTPGVLVLVGSWRWVRNLFSNRRSLKRGEVQAQAARIYRNMDRILTEVAPNGGVTQMKLGYEKFGLLVCEAVVLRDLAQKVLPKQTFEEFNEDFDSLIDLKSGVGRQLRVIDRMRWSYAKWLF